MSAAEVVWSRSERGITVLSVRLRDAPRSLLDEMQIKSSDIVLPIGAACADELAQRGVSVAVVEKGRIGHGCSYGNGGWMTPCVALPLAMPGMIWTATKWLVDPESPLYIAPRPSAELLSGWPAFSVPPGAA